jgi:hypothetical protein
MPLATLADLEARLGTETSNPLRAETLLGDASAAVVRRTRQDFERTTRTVEVWPGADGSFPLAGYNVAAVSAVTVDDVALTVEKVAAGRWNAGRSGPVYVTFTAGYDAVEDAGELEPLVGVVCNAVIRALGIDPASLGYQQQSAGPFAVTIGSAAAAGPFGFLAGELVIIDSYRGRPGPIRSDGWAPLAYVRPSETRFDVY